MAIAPTACCAARAGVNKCAIRGRARAGSQTRARYTLEYASPEVIRAVGAMRAHYVECKPSMDIWSLGVIIFEVLTGKAFFPLECNRDAMKDGLVGLEPLPVEARPPAPPEPVFRAPPCPPCSSLRLCTLLNLIRATRWTCRLVFILFSAAGGPQGVSAHPWRGWPARRRQGHALARHRAPPHRRRGALAAPRVVSGAPVGCSVEVPALCSRRGRRSSGWL